MKLPVYESDILKKSYCHLHDAYHNINCLFRFLKKEYPENASIEYTVLLNGLIRMQEIESIMGVTLNYPVFGKEIEMTDKESLKLLLRNILNVQSYGYLDYSDEIKEGCVNEDLHLYEVRLD